MHLHEELIVTTHHTHKEERNLEGLGAGIAYASGSYSQ